MSTFMISFVWWPPRAIRTSKEPTIASRASRASCSVASNRLKSDWYVRRRRCRRAPRAPDGSARRAPAVRGERAAELPDLRAHLDQPLDVLVGLLRLASPGRRTPRAAARSARTRPSTSRAPTRAARPGSRGRRASPCRRSRIPATRTPRARGSGLSWAVITQFSPTTHSSGSARPPRPRRARRW